MSLSRRTPMRRTGFTGNNFAPRVRPERTLTAIRVPAPSAPIFSPTPKHEYIRDESYRRFVASHACFRCGRANASQAAHSNSSEHGKGLSIKASDEALFPLCVTDLGGIGCHEMHDQAKDGLTKQQRRDQEVEWIALMEEIAAREGFKPKRNDQ